MMPSLQSLIGLVALPLVALALSENRRQAFSWRVIFGGIALQMLLAVLLLKVPQTRFLFVWLNDVFLVLNTATKAGTSVVFGYLGGGEVPFQTTGTGSSFVLAFQALPIVLIMSALSAVLFHWGVLQVVVAAFSAVLRRTFGIGGAVGVSTAANIFVGMVEAPLLVRPYLAQLTRSELFIVMTAGMATIAGTVLVLYAGLIGTSIDGAVGHLVVASVISAPAAIMIALIMVPPGEADDATSAQDAARVEADPAHSTMDAIARGTANGLTLFLNIIAMLIVFIALVSLVDQILGLLPDVQGAPITLSRILGLAFAPLTWVIGIPWEQAQTAGGLLGIKTVLNEFLAFAELAKLPPEALDNRSRLIMAYALCGFANFGSLAIMLGGLMTMVPERREELSELGLRTIVSGTLATLMTGAVVGVLTPA